MDRGRREKAGMGEERGGLGREEETAKKCTGCKSFYCKIGEEKEE